MIIVRSFVFLISVVCWSVPAKEGGMSEGTLSKKYFQELRFEIDKLVSDKVVPGMSAMVLYEGNVVFEHARGLLDVETKSMISEDSLFRIYSMTKPITAVATLLLQEDGKLELQDPVVRYFPEWSQMRAYENGELVRAKEMKIHHLLTHTSGLSYGYYGNTLVDKAYREAGLIDDWDYLTQDTRELVRKLSGIPLLFQPGKRWHYGFSSDVLGHLIERVSGQRLDEFLKEKLFSRLGVSDAFFDVPLSEHSRFGTNQYQGINQSWNVQDTVREDPEFVDVSFISGGGGLVMTTEAFSRFALMLAQEGRFGDQQILNPATVRKMRTNALSQDAVSKGVGYGLGVAVITREQDSSRLRPGSFYWGGAAGTFFWVDPAESLVAVFMVQRIGTPSDVAPRLQRLVYDSIDGMKGQ